VQGTCRQTEYAALVLTLGGAEQEGSRTVPENVSIAYRGANYAIGQGPQFYGIWHAAAPQDAPLEWWPLTPEGWTGAWSRFAAIEVPGTIAPASTIPPRAATAASAETTQAAAGMTAPASQTSQATGTPAPSDAAESPAAVTDGPSSPQADDEAIDPLYGQAVERQVKPARMLRNSRIGAGLVLAGVVLGVVGLFPVYIVGEGLAGQPANLVPHLIYLAAWAASAVLILLSGAWRQAGALIAAGVSVVTFGLFFADLGTPIAYGAHFLGTGLILSVIGWLACACGAVLACTATGLSLRKWRAGSQRTRLAGHEIVPTAVLILAAIGAAIAFAPSWDSYLLQSALGTSQTTLGNAFSNPAAVIVGDVAVMVLLVAVLVVAALWRPIRLGAALAAGALIPMVAQVISALVQVSEPTPPQQFGYTQAQAAEIGLKITNGLTPMFWVYCAFLGTLILLCAWMLLSQDSAPDRSPAYPGLPYQGQPYPGQPYPGQPYPGQPYPGQPYQGQPHGGQPYWTSTTAPSDAAPSDAAPSDAALADAAPADTVPPSAGGPGMPSHPAPQQ
jgi:hypothetical protein